MCAPSGEHCSASQHSAGRERAIQAKTHERCQVKARVVAIVRVAGAADSVDAPGGLRNWLGSLALWYNHTAIPLVSPITGFRIWFIFRARLF
jgi:hypothetical protein